MWKLSHRPNKSKTHPALLLSYLKHTTGRQKLSKNNVFCCFVCQIRNFFIPAYIPAVILVHHQKNSYPTAIPHIWNIRISLTDRYLCESSAIAHEIFQVFQGIGRARIRTIRLQHCHSFITVIRLLLDSNHFWKIESGRENFRDWIEKVLLLIWWIACLKCKMGQCNS